MPIKIFFAHGSGSGVERKRKVASGRSLVARLLASWRLRGRSSGRSVTAIQASGGRFGFAERCRRGHFFLAMPKTWPYIQKNRTREFFASERRTERRE